MSRLTRILFVLVGVAIVVSLVFTSSCSISPAPEVSSNVIYVSVSGSDTNDGFTPDSPLKSLPKALELASYVDSETNVEIRVGAGLYTPGNGISTGDFGVVINRGKVSIIGGWNEKFEEVVGVSELDGIWTLKHVVVIKNVSDVELRNLVIRKGKGDNTNEVLGYGGGIYATNVSKLTISNVVVSNNVAYAGGGIHLNTVVDINVYSLTVSSNSSYAAGGGIYLFAVSSGTMSLQVLNNYAGTYGGGMWIGSSTNLTLAGSVSGNNANSGSGGVHISSGNPSTNVSTNGLTLVGNNP